MPQLDLSTWISQIFWLIITFTAMYVVMSTLILPRMTSILERREQKISGDLKRAEELRADAQNIIEEYTEHLKSAREEAHVIIADATTKVTEEQDIRIAEFREKTRKITELSINAVLEAKKDALQEVDAMAVQVAGDVLDKVVGVKVNDDKLKSALKLVK